MTDIRTIEVDGLQARVRFEDGAYWATVDERPGVFATGDTLDHLRESLHEVLALAAAVDSAVEETGGP